MHYDLKLYTYLWTGVFLRLTLSGDDALSSEDTDDDVEGFRFFSGTHSSSDGEKSPLSLSVMSSTSDMVMENVLPLGTPIQFHVI